MSQDSADRIHCGVRIAAGGVGLDRTTHDAPALAKVAQERIGIGRCVGVGLKKSAPDVLEDMRWAGQARAGRRGRKGAAGARRMPAGLIMRPIPAEALERPTTDIVAENHGGYERSTEDRLVEQR